MSEVAANADARKSSLEAQVEALTKLMRDNRGASKAGLVGGVQPGPKAGPDAGSKPSGGPPCRPRAGIGDPARLTQAHAALLGDGKRQLRPAGRDRGAGHRTQLRIQGRRIAVRP